MCPLLTLVLRWPRSRRCSPLTPLVFFCTVGWSPPSLFFPQTHPHHSEGSQDENFLQPGSPPQSVCSPSFAPLCIKHFPAGNVTEDSFLLLESFCSLVQLFSRSKCCVMSPFFSIRVGATRARVQLSTSTIRPPAPPHVGGWFSPYPRPSSCLRIRFKHPP